MTSPTTHVGSPPQQQISTAYQLLDAKVRDLVEIAEQTPPSSAKTSKKRTAKKRTNKKRRNMARTGVDTNGQPQNADTVIVPIVKPAALARSIDAGVGTVQDAGVLCYAFDYHDEQGNILRRKLWPVDDQGNQKWGWDKKSTGVPYVSRSTLYRLPELLAADQSESLFYALDEPQVELLRAWTLLATTVGDSKTEPGQWQVGSGRVVYAVANNNDECAKQIGAVAKAFKEAGAIEVRQVQLTATGLVEWATQGHDKAEFLQLVESAPIWRQYKVFNLGDIYAAIGDVEWYWEDWVPRSMLSLIVARGGQGKTRFVVHALVAPLLAPDRYKLPDATTCDPPAGKARKVLWLDTESGAAVVVQMFKALELPFDGLIMPACVDAPDDPLAVGGVSLNSRAWQDTILGTIEQEQPGLVVVDSLTGGADIDLNSDAVKSIIGALAHIAQKTLTPVVLIHHANKPKPGKSEGVIGVHDVTGHSAITNLCRALILIDSPDPSDPTHRRIRPAKFNLIQETEDHALGARIDPLVTWTDEPPAEDCKPQRRSSPAVAQAVEWLEGELKNGPVAANDLRRTAENVGVSKSALDRAKDQLEVESEKATGQGGPWYWRLP